MVDGSSRFTSDRRGPSSSSWAGDSDWAAGVAENVDVVDGRLVGRPPNQYGELPDREDLYAHYDFSQEDGAMPVTDQTGNGYDLTNGSYAGVSGEAINGVQAGRFAVGDLVNETVSNVSSPQTIAAIVEFNQNAGGDEWDVFFDGDRSDTLFMSFNTSNGEVDTRDSPGGPTTGGSLSDQLIINKREQNDSELRTQGQQVGTGTQYETLTDVGLGSRIGDSDRNFDGWIGEILIYPMDKSGIYAEIEQYLADKWNISL